MSLISPLLDRNLHFASTGAHERVPGIPFHPNRGLYVVTCIDPRVDPSEFLELEMGDAIVARGIGGRVTPQVVQDLAYISYLVETKTPDGPWFEVAVIHHTDCGSALLADPALRAEFAARSGVDEDELVHTAVTDPEKTVREDVALVASHLCISANVRVSGHVYDVASGLLRTVVETDLLG